MTTASTINPLIPVTDADLLSQPIRNNFAAAYNDVTSLWNAIETLPGYGTIATQNADAVAITGGVIDGTSIGATTPSSGSFTNLSYTGTFIVPANTFTYGDIQQVSTKALLGNHNAGASNIEEIPINPTLNMDTGTLGVVDNTSTQKLIVSNNGSTIGTRHKINFVPSSGITYTITDNSGSDSVDVTVNSAAGTADVSGPASSTDNAITRFDGITGKLIQNSGATIDDGGNITATNLSGNNTGDVTLAGENYLSRSGQIITANPVTLSSTNVTGTLLANKGGTGQTTFTDGQLLIGKTDGTLAKATITQGANITITNGDGTITIASSGGGGGGVSSLNTLTGALSITSTDSSITITPSGSNVNLSVASNPIAIWALYT